MLISALHGIGDHRTKLLNGQVDTRGIPPEAFHNQPLPVHKNEISEAPRRVRVKGRGTGNGVGRTRPRRYRAVYVPASSSVLTMSVATRFGGENKRYFALLTS